jgi:transposase
VPGAWEQLDPKHPALPGLQAIVADRGYTGLAALAASHNLALDIKKPPPAPVLPPAKPGGKPRKGKCTFTPLRPLYNVEHAFARLGMWRRLSRCYGQTALGAQTWMEVACVAYLCGRLRVEPT